MRENGVFLTPVKYTLVCHTPKFSWFLGPHDTLLCVLIIFASNCIKYVLVGLSLQALDSTIGIFSHSHRIGGV